jgi:hypothetical protein
VKPKGPKKLEEREFIRLQERFRENLLLGILDVIKSWELQCDASGEQAGAVLVQQGRICRAVVGDVPSQHVTLASQ